MNAQQKRFLNSLNEVYDLTKDDYVHIALTNVIRKHKASNRLPRLIAEEFLDIMIQGRKYYYKWKSIKPNLKMVDKGIEECKKINKETTLKSAIKYASVNDIAKEQIQIKKTEPKIVKAKIKKDTHREEVIKEYRSKSISILWGLIKIKY